MRTALVVCVAAFTGAVLAGDTPVSILDLTVNTLEGKPAPLAAYKGKVLLVVNTASECGFTPQYEGLEKLYETYRERGVVVLGFPSNEFGGQEPGTPAEIRKFCDLKYHVQFPMFGKVKTKQGLGQAPVYQVLTAKFGEPQWNFHKYLVGRDGQVLAAFKSNVTPDSKELIDAIEGALAARP